jgi:biopolymer transport protein ExbD
MTWWPLLLLLLLLLLMVIMMMIDAAITVAVPDTECDARISFDRNS